MFEEVALIGKNTLKWLFFFQFSPGSNLSFPCRDYTSQTCLNLFDFSEWSSGTKSLVGSKSSLLCQFQSFAGGRKEEKKEGGKEREKEKREREKEKREREKKKKTETQGTWHLSRPAS